MSTLAERFAAAATKAAMELPDHRTLHNAIDAIANPGLSAATYEARVSGGTSVSHPERSNGLAGWDADDAQPNRSGVKVERIVHDGRDAQIRAAKAYVQAWDAICVLNALVVVDGETRGEPTHWSDVVKDAVMLSELNGGERIAAELDIDEGDVSDAVRGFVGAVGEIGELWREWTAHPPSQYVMDGTSKNCKNHARLGISTERRTRALCLWCWRQVQDLEPLGNPVALQLNPLLWPTDDMLRAHEDGRVRDLSAYRRDWLSSLGLNPVAISNRRRVKRSA